MSPIHGFQFFAHSIQQYVQNVIVYFVEFTIEIPVKTIEKLRERRSSLEFTL